VEFNPPVARKLEDDTKEVVRPQAVPYPGSSSRITVSRLVMLAGGKETSFPLTRDTYTLGRHRNNDIVVNDPKVSSFHARIDRGTEGFVVVDLNSRNGTFINGKRMPTGVLKHGDEVRLGTAKLLYKVDYQSAG
jgi:pSer/pThr/pTyr-binding forkhead associated (FHA) protein